MQIVCPNCETAYQVEPSSVGPTGRSVRCARCRTVWFAANTAALAEIAAAHRSEMAQFATGSGPDGPEAWPQPDGETPACGTAEESIAEPEPADVGFVHDAPPIATADSATSDDAPSTTSDDASAGDADGPLIES